MDPVTLTLGGIAAALVAKAAKAVGEGVAEGVSTALGKVVDLVRSRFAGDAPAEQSLAMVEQVQDSATLLTSLAEAIDRHASADAEFKKQLERAIEGTTDAGLDVGDVTQSVWGNANVQIANVTGSTITISGVARPASISRPRRRSTRRTSSIWRTLAI